MFYGIAPAKPFDAQIVFISSQVYEALPKMPDSNYNIYIYVYIYIYIHIYIYTYINIYIYTVHLMFKKFMR